MGEKMIIRGVSEDFADTFKKSVLHRLYSDQKSNLILGVRNGYLNLYYNCDSIAKIRCSQGKLNCVIAHYYLNIQKDGYISVLPELIESNFDLIRTKSDERSTPEKKAQAQLILQNNRNPKSNWFCVDVEYKKQFRNIEERDFNGRFDIVAISKARPHRVAFIELKYGSGAIGGESGIYKHVKDFVEFCDKGYFQQHFNQEVISILDSQVILNVHVPGELHNISKKDMAEKPEFYFITFDNNAKTTKGSTPKQTMAGYLFKDMRWDCKKLSKSQCVENDFGDITRRDNEFNASFLFSQAILPDLGITDIIDGEYGEVIRPK